MESKQKNRFLICISAYRLRKYQDRYLKFHTCRVSNIFRFWSEFILKISSSIFHIRHSSFNAVLLYRGILSTAVFSRLKTALNFHLTRFFQEKCNIFFLNQRVGWQRQKRGWTKVRVAKGKGWKFKEIRVAKARLSSYWLWATFQQYLHVNWTFNYPKWLVKSAKKVDFKFSNSPF